MIGLVFALSLSTPTALAEGCEDSPLFRQGGVQVWHHLDKKGRLTDTVEATTTAVSEDLGAYTAQVKSRTTDAKGKGSFEGEYTVRCNPFEQVLDLRGAVAASRVSAYDGWAVRAEGGALPFNMAGAPSATLADAELTLTFSPPEGAPGLGVTTMRVRSTERRAYEKPETVTVPAGTFAALRVSSTLTTETSSVGTVAVSVTEWFMPGVGVVKSEAWEKGKRVGSAVLAEQR